jgi:hypothetical protein
VDKSRNLLAGLAGALAGGALGYFVFIWAAQHGFYALMLPGAFAGAGASLFVTDRSVLRAVLCGPFALGLGLFAEWRFAPFIADKGLSYFVAHVHQLQTLTLLMVVGGAVLGGWLALGRQRVSQPG